MNLNKVFILGYLTKDVNLKSTPSGKSVADFGVATNRIWLDQNKQKQQEVEFHNIVIWGKMAELCNQYLAKGRLVFIEGRIRTRSWQDNNGQKRTRTEVIAENIQFGPRGGMEKGSFNNSDNLEIPSREKIPEINYDQAQPLNKKSNSFEEDDDDDLESIPF